MGEQVQKHTGIYQPGFPKDFVMHSNHFEKSGPPFTYSCNSPENANACDKRTLMLKSEQQTQTLAIAIAAAAMPENVIMEEHV